MSWDFLARVAQETRHSSYRLYLRPQRGPLPVLRCERPRSAARVLEQP
jgi:hypothetical protein